MVRSVKPWTALAAASVAIVLIGPLIRAQSLPIEGTWKLNLEKSKYSPGPPPKSQTLKWERIAGGFRFSVDGVNTQGQATHNETIEKDDGSESSVQGVQTPTMRGMKRIDDYTYEDHDSVGRKVTITRRTVISKDRRTLTVTMKGTNAQGQAVNNVVVYERQ